MTLTSRGHQTHAGHYLTYIDPATGELTAAAVHGFAERLDVYIEDDELRAAHAFWVFGLPFLILRYRIRPRRRHPSVLPTSPTSTARPRRTADLDF